MIRTEEIVFSVDQFELKQLSIEIAGLIGNFLPELTMVMVGTIGLLLPQLRPSGTMRYPNPALALTDANVGGSLYG